MLIIAPRQLFWQAYYKHGLPDRHSPLTFAVADRDYVMVEQLVRDGHGVNATNQRDGYPLLYAVKNDDLKMVRLLHNLGASMTGERNPLVWADTGTMVELLIELGANPNQRDKHGCTPLHYNSFENPIDVIWAFVKHGADVNALSNNGTTPLWEAEAWHLSEEAIAVLKGYGAKLPKELEERSS
jgi:ankyrin repeat protein